MIFNCHKAIQIVILSLIIFILTGDFYGNRSAAGPGDVRAAAQNLQHSRNRSFPEKIDHFLDQLQIASESESIRIFGKYREVVAGHLDLRKLYFAAYQEVEDLLNTAAEESIDALTLFTLPQLQKQNDIALIFDQELLARIDRKFDFHGLFNISIPAAGDGAAVKMKFLVIGQGKFIAGYSRNAKIKHPDYNFATGMYDYRELFIMDAKTDAKGNPGLVNIKALSKPDGELQWMKGPLNVDIHALILTTIPGGQRQILIQYDLFGIRHKFINPIPIEKRPFNEFQSG